MPWSRSKVSVEITDCAQIGWADSANPEAIEPDIKSRRDQWSLLVVSASKSSRCVLLNMYVSLAVWVVSIGSGESSQQEVFVTHCVTRRAAVPLLTGTL